jgi:hypothetical protein
VRPGFSPAFPLRLTPQPSRGRIAEIGGRMITASAWKFTADDEGHVYRIQVNNVDGKTRSIVEQSLHDWEESGEGWNNDGQILFFVKKFADTQVWEEWTKRFKDFNLKVLDREGKAKKEIKVDKPMFVETSTKRVCSKCKLPGHNAATCKDFHRKLSSQTPLKVETKPVLSSPPEEKGQRTCSICNEKGHNQRTCKMKK